MGEPGENVGEPQIDAKLDYVKHHQLHDAIHRLTMMYTEDIFKIEAKLRQTHPTKEAFDLAIQSIKPQDYVKLEQLQDTAQQIITKQTESMSKLEDKIKKLSTLNESLNLIVKPQEIKEEPMKLFKCLIEKLIPVHPYRHERVLHWINLNSALSVRVSDTVIRIDYGSDQILNIQKDHDSVFHDQIHRYLNNKAVTLSEITKDWPKYKLNVHKVWVKVWVKVPYPSYSTEIFKLSNVAYIEIGTDSFGNNCINVAFNKVHVETGYGSGLKFHTISFTRNPSDIADWNLLVSNFKKLCELMSE